MKTTKNTTKNGHIFQIIQQNLDNRWFWISKNKRIPLIKEQDDIDKIYLYAQDLSESKYELLIKKGEYAGTKYFSDPNEFIECSNTMYDIYENIDNYNPSRQRKVLIVLDDMIADIKSNKKFQAASKELFIRCRKLNISLFLSLSLIFLFQKMLN